MSANLVFKLAESLQMMHSTHLLRMPYQHHLEPIDYLLETSIGSKKWKINLNYEPSEAHKHEGGTFSKLIKSPVVHDSPTSPHTEARKEPNLNRMIKESAHKISCFKIPLKLNQNEKPLNQSMTQSQSFTTVPNGGEINRHSYSIGFMIRFDNNLINFSKSYGLNSRNISGGNSFESYLHLFSVNLDTEYSSFEIWLSSNGNILFM
jgi:hypothetical protein